MLHTLEPTRETLIGTFSRERAPIVTIHPGETVRYRLRDHGAPDWIEISIQSPKIFRYIFSGILFFRRHRHES